MAGDNRIAQQDSETGDRDRGRFSVLIRRAGDCLPGADLRRGDQHRHRHPHRRQGTVLLSLDEGTDRHSPSGFAMTGFSIRSAATWLRCVTKTMSLRTSQQAGVAIRSFFALQSVFCGSIIELTVNQRTAQNCSTQNRPLCYEKVGCIVLSLYRRN